MARRQVPARRDVRLPAAALGDNLLAHEEPELDADAGKADAVAARLRARRHVVIACQLAPSHARAVVDGSEGGADGVSHQTDAARAGVECVGDDLGEDRLRERAGVGIAEILEEVDEVDASLTHREPPSDC
jgi:hypothetical protein